MDNITRFECPYSGAKDLTLDVMTGDFVCNSCGSSSQQSFQIIGGEEASSADASSVLTSGTVQTGVIEVKKVIQKTTQTIFPHTHEEFARIRSEIDELRKEMKELQTLSPRIVVLEELPKEIAKERIETYFKKHGSADIEELMLNLRIPVNIILEIIEDLKQEGKLS